MQTALDAAAYAAVLEGLRRYEESEAIYRAALTVIERTYGVEHVEVAAVLHKLAAIVEARGDVAQAEQLYRRALAMREPCSVINIPMSGSPATTWDSCWPAAELSAARTLLERAVAILQLWGHRIRTSSSPRPISRDCTPADVLNCVAGQVIEQELREPVLYLRDEALCTRKGRNSQ